MDFFAALAYNQGMRFTDEQTERAIGIITRVIKDSGKPLLPADEVRRLELAAEQGDREADEKAAAAKLRMIFPTVPPPSASGQRALLWELTVNGQYEGITIADRLNYSAAWEDTRCGTFKAPLGSYFERWSSNRIKNMLAVLIADGCTSREERNDQGTDR